MFEHRTHNLKRLWFSHEAWRCNPASSLPKSKLHKSKTNHHAVTWTSKSTRRRRLMCRSQASHIQSPSKVQLFYGLYKVCSWVEAQVGSLDSNNSVSLRQGVNSTDHMAMAGGSPGERRTSPQCKEIVKWAPGIRISPFMSHSAGSNSVCESVK